MIESNTLLRIDRLILRNFRCFAECSLELHPELTVIVAENAQGKTALLDALSLALDVFVTAVSSGGKSQGFDHSSVHLVRGNDSQMLPLNPTSFIAEGYVDNSPVKWSRSLLTNNPHARTSTKDTKQLCALASRFRSRAISLESSSADLQPLLPIAAFYGTGRLWSEHRLTEGKKVAQPSGLTRFSAYLDCLSSSSSFKSFVDWYEKAFSDLASPTSKARGPEERLDRQIAAVEETVKAALKPTGWTSISWHFPSKDIEGVSQGVGHIIVDHPDHGQFSLSLLSDGVRNMVALVADLAYRCVRLNPHLGESAARLTPGVVLIDEIDMHLHPGWQQRVVELLQNTFPAMQLILTTHSPQVLSTVDDESVRLIHLDNGHGKITKPRFQTRGVMSADILAQVMDVHPVPQVEQARWLSDYRSLVQLGEHKSEYACSLWLRLIEHFGDEHPVLAEIETLRRLQEFKQANGISPMLGSDHA